MARRIVVTSGKGGVGKTTVVANLGMQIALKGSKTILLDVDIGLNNLDVASGIEERIRYDIVDIVEGKCRINQALVRDEYCLNLYYLPTAHIYNVGKVGTKDIRDIVNELDKVFDYIIIDCPAGIDSGFVRAIYSASEAIVVTTPHISAIRDADKVIGILVAQDISRIGVVVNRVRWDLVKRGRMLAPQSIAECLGKELIGILSEADDINASASMDGRVFVNSEDIIQEYINLANSVMNTKSTKYVGGKLGRRIC
ncbi:MAG: septum site-determining protein MinD [Clostridia bacterium]|nr:septum site-determining protein MinD [Clostridia bacterium]